MKQFFASLLFLVVCFGLFMLATNGAGVPATSWQWANPNSLDATSSALYLAGNNLANQAQNTRTAQAEVTRTYQEELNYQAIATREAHAQMTEIAQASRTAEVWQVTVEAARTFDAQTAEAAYANATSTQIVVNNKATADAIVLGNSMATQTQQVINGEIETRKKLAEAELSYQTRYLPTIAAIVVGALLIIAASVSGYWLLRMKYETNAKDIPVDPMTGRALPQLTRNMVVDVDLFRVPVQDPMKPIQDTGKEQTEIVFRNQTVRGVYGANRMGSRQRSSTQIGPGLQLSEPQPEQPENTNLPVSVSWSVMNQWPGKKWTLGQGAGGNMISFDPDDDSAPHLLGAGTTGSGKSHYLLHPIITQALADGWYVVALDRSGNGLGMFDVHPNFRMVLLDDPNQAAKYLEAAYQEIIRRQREMAKVNAWKWSMWRDPASPRMIFIMDEFSDLADDMDEKQDREQLWRRARMVAAEGRKAGILLAIALQDPTYKSIDLRIRRNCTRVAYQVQDADASRVILGVAGAERLAKRHFMTVIGAQVLEGVAFDITAEDVRQFLTNHPVPALAAPEWLTLEDGTGNQADPVIDSKVIQIARQIEGIWLQGGSKREMARAAGGEYAGSFAGWIDRAIEYLAATTTTKSGATGNSAGVAGSSSSAFSPG